MRIFLFVAGFLALVSGGLKFRDRIRIKIGTSPFALGELGLGIVSCGVAALSPPAAVAAAVGSLAILSVVTASVHQSRLTTAYQKRRDASEAQRLATFVDSSDLAAGPDMTDSNTTAPTREAMIAPDPLPPATEPGGIAERLEAARRRAVQSRGDDA